MTPTRRVNVLTTGHTLLENGHCVDMAPDRRGARPWHSRCSIAAQMSPVSIDLDAQIESLRGLKTDLDDQYLMLAESDRNTRYAFGLATSQFSQRIATLEDVVRHHGGDEVTFPPLTAKESRRLARALDLLDGEFVVEAEAAPAKLLRRVRMLLAAVDTLILAAAHGRRAQGSDHDRGRRSGVVLPLARSGR